MVAAANILTIKIQAEQPPANARQKTEPFGDSVCQDESDFLNHTAGRTDHLSASEPAWFCLSFGAKIYCVHYIMPFAIFSLLVSLLKIRKTYLHHIKWHLPQPSKNICPQTSSHHKKKSVMLCS